MGRYDDKVPQKGNKWTGLILLFLFLQPEMTVGFGVMAGLGWLVVRLLKKYAAAPRTTGWYTTRQKRDGECQQSFRCRHQDKAVHHVRRGKEIDPWDRPDIDISKYQRK